jgi:hypothetical protein
VSKFIGNLSYGGERPNQLCPSQPPLDWGSEKCPCCGGNALSSIRVCSVCLRDASYSNSWAERVKEVQAKLPPRPVPFWNEP